MTQTENHFICSYDFTLDEGGVEVSEDTNQQQFYNNHAKLAIAALSRLGGYKGLYYCVLERFLPILPWIL